VRHKETMPPHASLNGIRILVVEDESDTRDFLNRFLRGFGAEVVVDQSDEEALARVREGCVDLVVSDIGLPHVDRYDLMHRIRQMPAKEGGAVPAVAPTACARTETGPARFAPDIKRTWPNRSNPPNWSRPSPALRGWFKRVGDYGSPRCDWLLTGKAAERSVSDRTSRDSPQASRREGPHLRHTFFRWRQRQDIKATGRARPVPVYGLLRTP